MHQLAAPAASALAAYISTPTEIHREADNLQLGVATFHSGAPLSTREVSLSALDLRLFSLEVSLSGLEIWCWAQEVALRALEIALGGREVVPRKTGERGIGKVGGAAAVGTQERVTTPPDRCR